MSEQRWKPRVTVAAIIEHDCRLLLVEEETPDGLRLNNHAGHLETGESTLPGVVCEALEVTGRHFEPDALLGVYLARRNRHPDPAEDITSLRFAYRGRVGEPIPGATRDTGIVRTIWMTPDEVRASAARHRSPMLLRCMEDYLAGRGQPLDAVWCEDHIGPQP